MKKLVVFFLIIGVIISVIFFSNKKDKVLINNNALISYYVESEAGTGVYEKQEGTTWPDGYIFNAEKSICKNGSSLTWNSGTNSVVITVSKPDCCKIYLDKYGSSFYQKVIDDNNVLPSRSNFDSVFVENNDNILYSISGN